MFYILSAQLCLHWTLFKRDDTDFSLTPMVLIRFRIFINITSRELNSAENNNVSNNSLTAKVHKVNNLSTNNNSTGNYRMVSLKTKIIVRTATLTKEVGNMTLSRENKIETNYLSLVTVWRGMSKDKNCQLNVYVINFLIGKMRSMKAMHYRWRS